MGKLKVLRGGMVFARRPMAKMSKKAVKTSGVVGEAERGQFERRYLWGRF